MEKRTDKGLHPRNPHNERYDFPKLIKSSSLLEPFVQKNRYGDQSINFSNPKAVLELNRALLHHFYQIKDWSLPKGNLCPPIPGRADYIHYIADLLAEHNQSIIPKGKRVRALDIGVGANCIYPIIGTSVYGWTFVGSDSEKSSIESAESLIKRNSSLTEYVECRLQKDSNNIFLNIIKDDDFFDFTICNPPFHKSAKAAKAEAEKKIQNLNRHKKKSGLPKEKMVLNFSGKNSELWCSGGEVGFIKRMISESSKMPKNSLFYTTLVSKKESLKEIYNALKLAKPAHVRTIEMKQGQKTSRIIVWSFLSKRERKQWSEDHWAGDRDE